jgi:hypothetical protein
MVTNFMAEIQGNVINLTSGIIYDGGQTKRVSFDLFSCFIPNLIFFINLGLIFATFAYEP